MLISQKLASKTNEDTLEAHLTASQTTRLPIYEGMGSKVTSVKSITVTFLVTRINHLMLITKQI